MWKVFCIYALLAKIMTKLMSFSLLVLLYFCHGLEGTTLCGLNSSDTQNENSCRNDSLNLCDSFFVFSQENFSDAIGDPEVIIQLCSSTYRIHAVVTFRDIGSVSIFGVDVDGGSTLHCQTGNAGLQFINITTVEIESIILDQCSFSNVIDDVQANFSSSIYISGCIVFITDVTVQNTVGVGLALIENKYISITNSTFRNNRPGNTSAGGGVFIKSTMIENGSFIIENCTFTNNSAKNDSLFENEFGKSNSDDVIDFVRGGGVNIYFRGETHHVNLTILDSRFDNNNAIYGGALQITFTNSSHDIKIEVSQSHFWNNSARIKGGAVGAGFIHESSQMDRNSIVFSNCDFSRNSADQGGAVYLYAAPANYSHENIFRFQECVWTYNRAMYGSALKINPYISQRFVMDGHLPTPQFHDCTFISNAAVLHPNISGTTYQIRDYGKGALLTYRVCIVFQGEIMFKSNTGSAINVVSSTMELKQGTNMTFVDNRGYEGGAIALQGSSSIHINDDILISFLNNSAYNKGGAIFQEPIGDIGAILLRKCFILYLGSYQKNISERNTTLYFYNNTIKPYDSFGRNSGNNRNESIFLFSVTPCKLLYSRANDYLEVINSLANFTFADYQNDTDIATIGTKFQVSSIPDMFVPGKETYLNITILDDTNYPVSSPVLKIFIRHIHSGSVSIDPAYTYITNNKIKVIGEPGSQAEIGIVMNDLRHIELSFNITLQACPPGYILDETKCKCSAHDDQKYLGIKSCDEATFQAHLVTGYWAGYVNNNNKDNAIIRSDNFRICICPLGFCTNERHNKNSDVALHNSTSISELSKKVCNKNRYGKVCGNCINGTSVFYHTKNTFDCIEDKYCSWGVVFYFISEIVPVTILFLTVIIFDINLTTGALTSFIFYTQIFETLVINANKSIDFTRETDAFLELLNFFFGFFNLKFFEHSRLSFCLFEGATSLNIIAFNYVTVIYSLLLVLLTVALMNTRLNKLNKYIQKIKGRKTYISQSIIHGLSGFLVICYARSTKISLQILTPATLFAEKLNITGKAVFYYGEYDYFKDKHLAYAIPAIIALIFMSLLPPLLLLSFPLCYKVLALFGIQESKFTDILCKIIPLEKFKPFFDSFQGAFKDNHRYFAGLYFIYRLSVLLLFVLNYSLINFYFLLELQFILTLAIHSWIQPYKENWHNRFDIFIFILLCILNGITLYNYQQKVSQLYFHIDIKIMSRIQVFLAYTPIIFMIGYIVTKLAKKILTRCKKIPLLQRSSELEMSLSMLDRDECEKSGLHYQKCT